jgi:hypothetical protein
MDFKKKIFTTKDTKSTKKKRSRMEDYGWQGNYLLSSILHHPLFVLFVYFVV